MKKLKDFIIEWNRANKQFVFSFQEIIVMGRPVMIEIRYPKAKYREFCSIANWHILEKVVEERSDELMYVTTGAYLFGRGIIQIAVASCNDNYQEQYVIDTLRWIGEEFFPE